VTNDEAKAEFRMRLAFPDDFAQIEGGRKTLEAIRVALWLMEREPYVHAVVAANLVGDLEDAHSALFHWEREHPRPGSGT
jgi:hypothetical protein